MTWRVLITAPYLLPKLEEFRSRLESEGIEIVTVDVKERLGEADLLTIIGTIDGVICGDDAFTEKVMRAAPRLKVISKWGTGIDSIDLRAAESLGIQVCNTPNAFSDPVADSTLAYILCFARRIYSMDSDIRSNKWVKQDCTALNQCTLGLIGLGNIGKAVARRAHAFGMKVIANDTAPVDGSFLAECGIEMLPLNELLQNADFVSLHCDLNLSSHCLIGRHQLELMKSSSYLINTSRGRLIDEPALVEALRDKRIAGAALDVFENEPLPDDSPLRSMDNCLLAPHNANSDLAARARVHESTINNLIKALRRTD